MTGTSNEHEIRRLVEDCAAAVRARDVEGAVAHHAGDIVMFDVPLPLQSRGTEEYRKTWELFFANNRGGPVEAEGMEPHLGTSPDVSRTSSTTRNHRSDWETAAEAVSSTWYLLTSPAAARVHTQISRQLERDFHGGLRRAP